MAKKNARSDAANSSSDDIDSPVENEPSMDLTTNKRPRGRRRPVDSTEENWSSAAAPENEASRSRFSESQELSGEEQAQPRRRPRRNAVPQESEPDVESNHRSEQPERSGEERPLDWPSSNGYDSPPRNHSDDNDESSRTQNREGHPMRTGDTRRENTGESRFNSRNENRRDGRNDNRDGRNDNRDSRNDNRDGRNDNRRRSRRRRGGGGGERGPAHQGGGSSSNYQGGGQGNRQQQDNQRGNSRRGRRGRNKSFGQDRGPERSHPGQDRHQHSSRQPARHHEPVELDDAELIEGVGMLEIHPNGYGFLRQPDNNYSREKTDAFVPGTMIEKFSLRPGVVLRGMIQPGRRQQGPRLRELFDVDGIAPDEYVNVKNFDDLTPINPVYWYRLESGPAPLTTRVMDLLTPLGKGQRALIVAPPRSGKTVMLQHIANGIAENHPKTKLIVMLIDERPEEVTDMKRNVRGEVIASSLDEDIESHVRLSQIVIARCKRLAEMGQDVFLLLDSITRLARAFNKWVGNTGRTMTGGVDIKAMDIPKKLFSSARAFEEGGSLTIVGTALIDTGSRMDELIFQEFKGTGNMEMVLDRKLADRRIWPAIDITQSGTRREELLLHPDTLHAVTMLRRTLTSMNHVEAMEQLTKQLSRFKTNQEFINLISGKMGEL